MDRYKNSILKYNPRSYIELYGAKVNAAIRDTILSTRGNEFALLNNGITILSDETSINERIGPRNKAQLHLRNPQVINGGQTAYTLSMVYDECIANGTLEHFDNKEGLVKVITLISEGRRSNAVYRREVAREARREAMEYWLKNGEGRAIRSR